MEEHDGTHIGDQHMRDSTWNAATDITPVRDTGPGLSRGGTMAGEGHDFTVTVSAPIPHGQQQLHLGGRNTWHSTA